MKVDYLPFTELLSDIVDNRGRTCPTTQFGIPLIATNCIKNDMLFPAYEKARYISQETYDTWFRGHPKPGDLIFVTKGSPGCVCVAPNPVDFCIAQDMVAVRADSAKIYPKYLFATLRSPEMQNQIVNMHVGTLIPHFKKGDFDKLLLPGPDREIQEVIGDMYFDFSAKIELNRRMNRTLDTIARAVFRQWFVENEEVGIWEEKSLYDCAEYINGAAYKDFDFSSDNSGLPIIKIAEIKNGITSQTRFTNKQMGEKYRINDGDILFAWSGSPDTSIDTFIWADGEGWLNQHIFKVIPPHPNRKWFTYLLLKDFKEIFIEIARDKQTTGLGHVTVKDLNRLTFSYPPENVLAAFSEIIDPMIEKLFANEKESRTLASLRDSLLPRLMRGEVRVKHE